jgi:tetratricopeptide (TPR) repeat protein
MGGGACRRAWRGVAVALLIAMAPVGNLVAQGAARDGDSALKSAYDAAFTRMLREPANLDVIFDFARLAAQLGDMEGAIGAYERMLIYNPNLPTVRFELGRLYYLLGSYAFADNYFRGALESDVPPEVRAEIERFRAEIAKRQSVNRVFGSFGGGVKYQSNANAAPAAVRVFGINTVLDPGFQRRQDGSVYISGDLVHVYDFQSQSGVTLETAATMYAAQQITVKKFSLAVLEITPGVRVPLLDDPGAPTLSVRPYAIGDFVALDYAAFYDAIGAGINFRSALTPELQLNLDLEYRHRGFTNTQTNPALSIKDGDLKLVRLLGSYLLSPKDVVAVTTQYSQNSAAVGSESYQEYLLNGSYAHIFNDPWALTGTNWIAAVQGGVALRPYNQPDPIVDPGATRYDHDWTVGTSLNVGLTDTVSGLAQVQHQWVRSSLPNFRYDNTTALLGLRVNF